MPARNGAWNRFGSVAVTEFQRSVFRNAAKCRGSSKPRDGEVVPALLLEDAAVELVVPEHLELLALRVVVGAGEVDDGTCRRRAAGPPRRASGVSEPAPTRLEPVPARGAINSRHGKRLVREARRYSRVGARVPDTRRTTRQVYVDDYGFAAIPASGSGGRVHRAPVPPGAQCQYRSGVREFAASHMTVLRSTPTGDRQVQSQSAAPRLWPSTDVASDVPKGPLGACTRRIAPM